MTSREHRYPIDVDRDTNGAGLVYFANYVAFMDTAERLALDGVAPERSLRHRRIAYYGNADVERHADDRGHGAAQRRASTGARLPLRHPPAGRRRDDLPAPRRSRRRREIADGAAPRADRRLAPPLRSGRAAAARARRAASLRSATTFRFENSDLFALGPLVDYLRDHPRHQRRRVVFFGNSMIFGYFLTPAQAIPAQFQTLQPEARVYNAAVNGQEIGTSYLVGKAIVDSVDTIYVQVIGDKANRCSRR